MTFDAQLLRREPEPERNVRTTATLQLEQALDVVFAWLIDLEIKPRLNGSGDVYRDMLFRLALLRDDND